MLCYIICNSYHPCPVFVLDGLFRTRFAEAARIYDFSARDISMPEPERTLYILSAFINFIKFTEQHCNPLAIELRDKSATLIAQRDQVTHDLDVVQNSIDISK
jgi:kinetochore protein Nuf2